jgi:O-antigen ligase
MYFYLANHVTTWEDVRLIMVTVVLCLLFEAAFMVLQYYTGTTLAIGGIASYSWDGTLSAGATGPRVGGTMGTPNSAASYLAAALVLTLATYFSGGLANAGLIVSAGSLGMIALIATASRSAWGSLVLSISLLMTQVILTPTGRRAIAIVLVAGSLVGLLFGAQIARRLASVTSDTSRQELAYMAHNIIDDYPLGIGENNYDQVMSDKYAHPNWVGRNLLPVHNKYLLVWSETGLHGLIAFALMLLATAWLAVRRLFIRGLPAPIRILLGGFLAALCGYAFHMNSEAFSSRATNQLLWFLIAMIAALGRLALQQAPAEERGALLAGRREA